MYVFSVILIVLSFHCVRSDGPDLVDLLNNHGDVTTTLTRKALRNLVLQANELIENLTQIQNQSSTVFKELIKLNQTLFGSAKQSDLPKSINKNQLGEALSDLANHNEQVKKAGTKFGGFLDNLKDFQSIFNDRNGVDNAFASLVTSALLRSNAKKLQDKYGLSNDFFDGLMSLFQKNTNFKDTLYKMLNPCDKENCANLQNGFTQVKKLLKLSDATNLADVIDKPYLLTNLFNGSLLNVTSFNFTIHDNATENYNNQTHAKSDLTLLDKIVSFFNNPKSALEKLLIPEHATTVSVTTPKPTIENKVAKLGSSLADLLNSLFKPSTNTKTDDGEGRKKNGDDYYDVLYGHKSDHNFE